MGIAGVEPRQLVSRLLYCVIHFHLDNLDLSSLMLFDISNFYCKPICGCDLLGLPMFILKLFPFPSLYFLAGFLQCHAWSGELALPYSLAHSQGVRVAPILGAWPRITSYKMVR
jgi:hypothetical protein